MKTVTSIVYTRFLLFDQINILTKFHKDWMKTVISTVYTNKLLMDARTHNGCQTSHGHISSPCHFVTVSLPRKGFQELQLHNQDIQTDRRTMRSLTICPPSGA
ncbi:hypothetical protein DPMN_030826 [Dreissena polymorpha]|uniref:Uncharacterized protein n=1 Tax=Dreissena polymorpha TaxID=45954 RepID=A0A9D4M1H3_DREPO|nr:hypothetical protein DPMN_030826 [Dreissena polymorpha]